MVTKTKEDYKSGFTGSRALDLQNQILEATIDLRNETEKVKDELVKLNNK